MTARSWRDTGPIPKRLKAGDRVTWSQVAHEALVASRRATKGTVLSVWIGPKTGLAYSAKVKWDELKTPRSYATEFLKKIRR